MNERQKVTITWCI